MYFIRIRLAADNPEIHGLTPQFDVAWKVVRALLAKGMDFTVEVTDIDGEVTAGDVYVARSGAYVVVYDTGAPVGSTSLIMSDVISWSKQPFHKEVLEWVEYFNPPNPPEEEKAEA